MGRGAGVLGRSKPKLENVAPVSEAGRAQNLKDACLLVVDAAASLVISLLIITTCPSHHSSQNAGQRWPSGPSLESS